MGAVTDTITFTVNKEQSVADTASGTNAGSGGDDHAPIGDYNSWRWRELIRASQSWGSIPAGGRRFVSAELWMKTTTDVHVNTGGSPRIRAARLADPFTAGGGGENNWSWGGSYDVWPGPGTTGSAYDLGVLSGYAENKVFKFDISDMFEPWVPSSMQKRDGSAGAGQTNNGCRLYSFSEGDTSRTCEFYSMRGSYAPRFVVTYKDGVLPGPPTLAGPSGVVSSAPTTFTGTATETPVPKYDVQVSTDPAFGSFLWNAVGLTTGISGATCAATYAGSAQPGNTPIYWRMRTANDLGVYGGWSASNSYTISTVGSATISYPVADGLARISNLTEVAVWDDASPHAKPQVTWRFVDAAGRQATSITVNFYTDVGVLENTYSVTGPFDANTDYDLDTTFAILRNVYHKVEIIPYVGAVAQTSSGLRRFRCQWGQGQYTCAPGATATGHRFVPGTLTGTDARVAFLHRFRGGTTGPWASTIAGAGAPQTNWDILVRMGTRTGMPVLPQMQAFWTVAAATPPDQWLTTACTIALDESFRRFGVKSLKVTTNASVQGSIYPKPDPNAAGVIVSGSTRYTLSIYVHTLGRVLNAPVILAAQDEAGVQFWSGAAVASAKTSDSSAARDGWQRIYGTFTTPEGAQRMIPVILVGGGASEELRLDAVQLEEGSYASLWTPGLLGPQVILDKGGLAVDATRGGFFRLAGSLHVSGDRNVVELYQHGLRFGNTDEVYSPASGAIQLPALDLPVLGAAPANPAATTARLYARGTALYWRDSAGNETLLSPAVAPSVVRTLYRSTTTWASAGPLAAGCRGIDVEVIGNGGGGGGVAAAGSGAAAAAGGGGGGGYAKKYLPRSVLSGNYTVTVPAAASGGTTAGGDGGAGGTVSFAGAGITTVQATGGSGGLGDSAPTSSITRNAGGAGGIGSGGDLNAAGSVGGNGMGLSGQYYPWGYGAPAANFSGSVRQPTSGAGTNGADYGGGGSGASIPASTSPGRTGGNGAQGAVIVTEYY